MGGARVIITYAERLAEDAAMSCVPFSVSLDGNSAEQARSINMAMGTVDRPGHAIPVELQPLQGCPYLLRPRHQLPPDGRETADHFVWLLRWLPLPSSAARRVATSDVVMPGRRKVALTNLRLCITSEMTEKKQRVTLARQHFKA
jgi:hypothetical protein